MLGLPLASINILSNSTVLTGACQSLRAQTTVLHAMAANENRLARVIFVKHTPDTCSFGAIGIKITLLMTKSLTLSSAYIEFDFQQPFNNNLKLVNHIHQ